MEDKLFQFYRNECFMSCPSFPDSVLHLYISLNACVFSTRSPPWTLCLPELHSQNTRLERADIFFPDIESFVYLSPVFFLKIDRKRNSFIMPCLAKTTITILAFFLPISFSMHQVFSFPYCLQFCVCFVLSHN